MKAYRLNLLSDKSIVILSYAMVTLFSFACIYPMIYVLANSLSDPVDAESGGIWLVPRKFSFENYSVVLSNPKLLHAFWISLYRVVVGTTASVVLNATFAFALSKKYIKGRKLLNWMVIIPLFFGGGLIPTYLVLNALRLTDSMLTYIIPALYSSYHIILLRSFFVSLPEALEEAARIDGAGDLHIFFRLIFPLSAPVIAAITLFIGVYHWNDWFVGTAYIIRSELWTLQNVLLSVLKSADVTAFHDSRLAEAMGRKVRVTVESLKMALIIVTILPIVTIYPFLQRYFVSGVMIGSLKE
jgi:putative aldouronate transport system permease protein